MWLVVDVILTAYTSIIYMFRKMAVLDSTSPQPPITDLDIPNSPIVTHAARQIVACLGRLLVLSPGVETMTAIFGAYRCYVAVAILEFMNDIESLDHLGNQALLLSRGQRDIMPLVKAMQTVNVEIRHRVARYRSSMV